MALWAVRRTPATVISPLRAVLDLGVPNDVQVVVGGGNVAGSSIAISPDGAVLAFVGQRIMVVSYRADGEAFQSDTPRAWSNRRYVPMQGPLGQNRRFDLHPDGQRMAVALAPETTEAINKVALVTGFFDELRRVAPTK